LVDKIALLITLFALAAPAPVVEPLTTQLNVFVDWNIPLLSTTKILSLRL
jgi:hypothetical protein